MNHNYLINFQLLNNISILNVVYSKKKNKLKQISYNMNISLKVIKSQHIKYVLKYF